MESWLTVAVGAATQPPDSFLMGICCVDFVVRRVLLVLFVVLCVESAFCALAIAPLPQVRAIASPTAQVLEIPIRMFSPHTLRSLSTGRRWGSPRRPRRRGRCSAPLHRGATPRQHEWTADAVSLSDISLRQPCEGHPTCPGTRIFVSEALS